MHVSNSHAERSAMAPAPVPEPTPSEAPELPLAGTGVRDGERGRLAQSARYVAERKRSLPAADSVEEGDALLMLEMRYQECMARRALDEMFESGEAQSLAL